MLETDLFGRIPGAHEALTRFREQGGGVLVNMSSVWVRLTSPYVGFFFYGLVLAPALTRLVAAIFTISDYLHQAYMAAMKRAQ